MTRSRRSVLVALGAAVLTGGCLGSSRPAPADPSAGPGTPTDTPGFAKSTGAPSETGADPPATSTTERPFAGEPCPSFVETDRTVCWHDRPDDAPVVLEPDTGVFEPIRGDDTVETFGFRLRNRSDRPFGLNPHAWRIERRTDDGWRHVAPDAHIEPWFTVGPGEAFEWMLATENHPSPNQDRTVQIVEDLDSGTYAFGVDGTLGSGEGSETVECVALFETRAIVVDPPRSETGTTPNSTTTGNSTTVSTAE